MRRNGTVLAGCAALAAALVMACDGGPTGVVGFNVAGGWVEVSTLTDDECDSNFEETVTTPLTIIYNGGTQITFLYHLPDRDVAFIGNFNTQTHQFVLPFGGSDPVSGDGIVGLQSGTFTSESTYTSITQIAISDNGETCTIRTAEVGQRA